QPAEIGVSGRGRVVVLPLASVLGPDLVLGRPRDQHLLQLPDPLGAPARAPDLLDLVVEVGLVEHVVAERLARLEPGRLLEYGRLVVPRGRARRRVRELDRLAVGGDDAERYRLPRAHRPASSSVASITPRYTGNE